MSDRKPDYKKMLDELLRKAPARLNARARANLRRKTKSEAVRKIERIEREIRKLHRKISDLQTRSDMIERVNLKAEVVRLREIKRLILAEMRSGKRPRQKPPEAGLAVPVEPPKGPKPKLGGAEAPFDFDDSRS